MFFKPGQNPFYANGKAYYHALENPPDLLLSEYPMFHYSFVRRTSWEVKRRLAEYCVAQRQMSIFDWIEQVYLQWSPENAEEIYNLNKIKFNNSGIMFNDALGQQRLQVYEGDHPAVLDDHPFRHIDDVRKLDKLSKPAYKYILMRHHLEHYGTRFYSNIRSIIRNYK